MKTLNERVYEALLHIGEPVTLSQLNNHDALKDVPRMALGESLRGLGNERIVSYRIIGGKIYFSANPKYGECQNPSQANVQNLSSAFSGLAGLSAMLSDMNDGPAGFSGILDDEEEDETEEYDSIWDSITFENGERIYGNGYSICLPAGCTEPGGTEEHDIDVWYPEGSSIGDYLLHFVVTKPNLKKEMEPFSADLTLSFAQLVSWQLYDQLKDFVRSNSEVTDVEGNGVKGTLSVSGNNYMVQLAVPGGIHTLRIDVGDYSLKPKNQIKKIICDWISTYQCERSFPVQEPFNSQKYLSSTGRTEFVDNVNLAARLLIALNERRNEIAEYKCKCLGSTAYRSATKLIMQERADREAFAAGQSAKLAELLEAVKFYKSIGLSEEEFFAVAYVVQAYLLGTAPVSYINLPKGNLGAYDSSTDIKIGANNETIPVAICAMPEHYEELFELVSTAVAIGENAAEFIDISSNIKQVLYNFHREQNVIYNTEFKIEGSLLAAYLGDDDHVVVPEGITAISDTVFANCKNLKTVEIPEGVTSIGYGAFENCPNLVSIKMPDSITSMFPALFGYNVFEKKNTPKFIVYKGSYAETFAKENKIPYEIIKEDDLEAVFSYKEGRRDTIAGLSILVPDGFATTEQLSLSAKLKFKEDDSTSHLYYAAVSADANKNFAEYKNVAASFSIAGKPMEYEDAADEMNVEFILSRVNTPHKNETFRIETLKKNKLVVAYDMGNSGIENGTPWVMYPGFVFTRKHVIPIQFFFNDHYTDRQHNLAVKQWIKGIIDEETLREQERKRKAKEKCKQKQEEEKRIAEEKKKQEIEENKVIVQKCLDQIEEYKTQVKLAVNEKKNRTTAGIMQRIEQLKVEKQSHEATLKSLGLFSFSDKKREKEEIARIETEIEMLSKPDYLSEKLKKIQQNGDASVKKYKADVEDFLAKKYNLDYKQKKAKIDIKAVNAKEMKNDRYATDSTKKNNLMQLEILKIVYDANKKMTISDIVEQLEKSKDNVSIHLVRAFVCQLKYDNYLKRSENKGYEYFAITDSAIKRLKSAEPTEPEKTAEPYVENKFYSKQKCPEMPIIEEVI